MPYTDREKQREYQRLWMAKRRAEWLRGKKCARCGSKYRREIDHKNPAQKVDHKVWSWRKKRRDAELAKCQVLCLRCHKRKNTAAYPTPQHGTSSRYNWRREPCRCSRCRAANAARGRRYRQALRRQK